jgi:hypothetical protein
VEIFHRSVTSLEQRDEKPTFSEWVGLHNTGLPQTLQVYGIQRCIKLCRRSCTKTMNGKIKNVYATNHEDNKGHKHQFNKKKESEILYGLKREENTLPSYPPHLTIVI